MEKAIRESVQYAFANPDAAENYIRDYAQEMSISVIRQHIDLYVNNFTENLGAEGEKAVNMLFRMSRECGLLPQSTAPLFAC